MDGKKSLKESPRGLQLHKLNNSLGAILGFSSLLRRHLADDSVGLEYTNKITEAVRDALERAEQLANLEMNQPASAQAAEASLPSAAEKTQPYTAPAPNTRLSEGVRQVGTVDWPQMEGCERLLVVEDDTAFRSLLETFLGQLGYDLVCAEDGIEAVELFSSQPQDFDLVCLDRDLPRMSGLLVASKIRELRPRIRMILLSGTMLRDANGDEAGIADIRDLGFAAVLKKPIPLGELAQTLRRVLDQPS